MIRTGADRWVHDADIRREIPGRDDAAEEREECLRHLKHTGAAAPNQALRAGAELAAARVLSVATGRSREAELERALADANRTINRLLAFVPARGPAIKPERQHELVRMFMQRAHGIFPTATRLSVMVNDETDADSSACHRITVEPVLPTALTDEEEVSGVTALHRIMASLLSADERKAVRLIVEPTTEASRESGRQS